MATTLQVLCPNGRRQNVKVTANTKLLQVLEEVCTKQSFLPPDDYDLIHGRKALDLTLAFRFSNLPNNAKLEMVKASAPRSQAQGEVIIALQLENGERLQHTFQSSVSLWEILQHYESTNRSYHGQLTRVDRSVTPPQHPVCIYMRDEIVGETALRDTTLKKLALTSGKVIIRLVHRPVDDATLCEIQAKIDQENARQAKLLERARQQADPFGTLSSCSQVSSPVDPSSPPPVTRHHAVSSEERMEVEETGRSSSEKERSNIPEPMESSVNAVPFKSDAGPVARRMEQGAEEGASGVSSIERLRSLNIPGVDIITPQDFNALTAEEQQVARALAQHYMPGLMSSAQQQQALPAPKKPKTSPQPKFADFKFPEETKGKDLYRNELTEVKPEDFKPCEREAVIYDSNEQNTSKALAEDVTDDFFEVTETDIRSMYKDLQKQVSVEKPLLTEAMRQAELEEKHRQYEYVVIRVQFPDGLVLQGCFRPRETVFALHKFVKDHLEDGQLDFYLYRTPPKQVISDTARTLVQADLAPATLLFFSTENKEVHHLAASARQKTCPKRRADELSVKKLARKQMQSLATGCSSGGDVDPTAKRGGTSKAETSSGRSSTEGGDLKAPKWLKIGKK